MFLRMQVAPVSEPQRDTEKGEKLEDPVKLATCIQANGSPDSILTPEVSILGSELPAEEK